MQVDANSVKATIHVTCRDQRVGERLAAAALALRPRLAQHVCKQRGYGHFGDTIVEATLPHLVEHIAIDLLVEDEPQRARAGTTTWVDRQQGIMKVRVSCFADTTEDANRVCAAITQAIALVNDLFAQGMWYIQ
jgi:RNA binding exosome subunit